jgi:hypothetical protein
MGGRLICPRQRLMLARVPPAGPDKGTTDMSTFCPLDPVARKLPTCMELAGCSVQPEGTVQEIFLSVETGVSSSPFPYLSPYWRELDFLWEPRGRDAIILASGGQQNQGHPGVMSGFVFHLETHRTAVAGGAFHGGDINTHVHRMLERLSMERRLGYLVRRALGQDCVTGGAFIGDNFSLGAFVGSVVTSEATFRGEMA